MTQPVYTPPAWGAPPQPTGPSPWQQGQPQAAPPPQYPPQGYGPPPGQYPPQAPPQGYAPPPGAPQGYGAAPFAPPPAYGPPPQSAPQFGAPPPQGYGPPPGQQPYYPPQPQGGPSVYDGVAGANVFAKTPYFPLGEFVVDVDEVKPVISQSPKSKGQRMIVVLATIVSTNVAGVQAGNQYSQTINLDKYGLPDFKAFLAACYGANPNKPEQLEHLAAQGAFNKERIEEIVGPSQPFGAKRKRLRLTTFMSSSGKFTKHIYTPESFATSAPQAPPPQTTPPQGYGPPPGAPPQYAPQAAPPQYAPQAAPQQYAAAMPPPQGYGPPPGPPPPQAAPQPVWNPAIGQWVLP